MPGSATTTQPDGDRVIATIPNGRRGEELRVSLNTFKGRHYFAMRIWYADDAGEMKPSGKGANLKIDLLPDIAEAVNKALALARDEGLLK